VLSPGTRMIERAGVLHLYDGRRLVSLGTDQHIRSAIAAIASFASVASDSTQLGEQLKLDAATVEQLISLLSANALIDTDAFASRWPASTAAQFVGGLGTAAVSTREADERISRTVVRVWTAP